MFLWFGQILQHEADWDESFNIDHKLHVAVNWNVFMLSWSWIKSTYFPLQSIPSISFISVLELDVFYMIQVSWISSAYCCLALIHLLYLWCYIFCVTLLTQSSYYMTEGAFLISLSFSSYFCSSKHLSIICLRTFS